MDLSSTCEGDIGISMNGGKGHSKTNISEVFQTDSFAKVCAPMVRYSKLPFRLLVRKYKCDLCFTPMIMADSFVQSAKARRNEFTTCEGDTPLIVQFASKNVDDFVNAAEIVAPFSDGVDLNCGCPQRWAMKDGYGAHLLTKPDLIRDIVLQLRNRIPEPYSVSVKLRLLDTTRLKIGPMHFLWDFPLVLLMIRYSPDGDFAPKQSVCSGYLRLVNSEETLQVLQDHTFVQPRSVELCRSLEAAGVTFLTVHARTVEERHSPIHVNALRDVCQSVQTPIIANGDVKSLDGARELHHETRCKGVMSARGILSNPAFYAGHGKTPLSCVQDWINISLDLHTPFNCFHHHLVFMLEQTLPKAQRCSFNKLKTSPQVLDFLRSELDLSYQSGTSGYSSASFTCESDEDSDRPGSYFVAKVTDSEAQDDVLSDLGALYI